MQNINWSESYASIYKQKHIQQAVIQQAVVPMIKIRRVLKNLAVIKKYIYYITLLTTKDKINIWEQRTFLSVEPTQRHRKPMKMKLVKQIHFMASAKGIP